jgi:hypothetical protein
VDQNTNVSCDVQFHSRLTTGTCRVPEIKEVRANAFINGFLFSSSFFPSAAVIEQLLVYLDYSRKVRMCASLATLNVRIYYSITVFAERPIISPYYE